ncbi:MAG TPA: hypothetical protein PL069_03545 [Saprospiraceae bacterium]|nr:hypothetical protein [Saprospiraceae bacterium]
MGGTIARNLVRFVFILLLQVLVFRSLTIYYSVLDNISIIIYPVIIMLLPMRTPGALILVIAFVLGILVDMFYNTPGVHASACVFTGFIRPFVLSRLEPRGGYTVDSSPTIIAYGNRWFLFYSSILLLLHLFFLFSVQKFTFVYFLEIITRTFLSFIASMIFILVYMYLFNPKE